MDRGKSDSSSRSIAIGQTLCLVVQIIIRQRRHLEVSQLEIGTAAFVSCAITIYALNWHKPKDIGVPRTLWAFPGCLPDEFSQIRHRPTNVWILMSLQALLHEIELQVRASFVLNHHRYALESHRQKCMISPILVSGLPNIAASFYQVWFSAQSTLPSSNLPSQPMWKKFCGIWLAPCVRASFYLFSWPS